jgi:hypothetical protein
MKRAFFPRALLAAALAASALPAAAPAQAAGPVAAAYRQQADRLIDRALADSTGWNRPSTGSSLRWRGTG